MADVQERGFTRFCRKKMCDLLIRHIAWTGASDVLYAVTTKIFESRIAENYLRYLSLKRYQLKSVKAANV